MGEVTHGVCHRKPSNDLRYNMAILIKGFRMKKSIVLSLGVAGILLSGCGEEAQKHVEQAKQTAHEATQQVVEKAKEAVSTNHEAMVEKVKAVATQKLEETQKVATDMVEKAKAKATEKVAEVAQKVADEAQKVAQKAEAVTVPLQEKVQTLHTEVKTAEKKVEAPATKEATKVVEKAQEVAQAPVKAVVVEEVVAKVVPAVEVTPEAVKVAPVAVVEKVTTVVVDNAKGKELFAKCAGCHGADGKQKALGKSALIAGEKASDLAEKISAYKAGTRNVTGMGALMKGQVATMSDADIEAVSNYISGL